MKGLINYEAKRKCREKRIEQYIEMYEEVLIIVTMQDGWAKYAQARQK